MSTKGTDILLFPVDPSPGEISRFVNKTVPFRFNGRDLSFRLSHGLFSSFDVDTGSRLLLKTLAKKVDFGALQSTLDFGCGIGVIGACIGSQAPGATLVLQDRDALAAALAAVNCRDNGIGRFSSSCGLAFWGLNGRQFDLVTSNLPAKAGQPVLESFLRHAAGCLTPQGLAAVVVVAPLSSFIREKLADIGCEIAHLEETAGYAVIHFRAGSAEQETDARRENLSPYIRVAARFSPPGFSYSLQTAYALPDFDVLGHSLAVSFEVLKEAARAERLLVWNPGQGHLPAGLLTRPGWKTTSVEICSHDALQCAMAERNLSAIGIPPVSVRTLWSESQLREACAGSSFDLIIASPRQIPRVPWQGQLGQAAAALLGHGGELLVAGSSTEIRRFLDQDHGFRLRASRKHAGFRAALLRKP